MPEVKPTVVPRVVGLDLSLRAAAMCTIPIDWDAHNVQPIMFDTCGLDLKASADEEDRVDRIGLIVHTVLRFCEDASHVWVEDYAYSQGHQSSARVLAELGGAVKLCVRKELGLVVRVVTASSARKTLLQKLPRAGSKEFTHANVKRLPGAAKWTGDEVDAFVIANHAMRIVGTSAMSFEGITLADTKEPSRRRRA